MGRPPGASEAGTFRRSVATTVNAGSGGRGRIVVGGEEGGEEGSEEGAVETSVLGDVVGTEEGRARWPPLP